MDWLAWIALNWHWIAPIGIPVILGMLKIGANKTKWVLDDKIVTLLFGMWDIVLRKPPRNSSGK